MEHPGPVGPVGPQGPQGPAGPAGVLQDYRQFKMTSLDTAGSVGTYASITIGADGLPVISYHDLTNRDLKVAHCSDTACSSATTSTLDTAAVVGTHTSITIGADGLPIVSYYDENNLDLKVAALVAREHLWRQLQGESEAESTNLIKRHWRAMEQT